MKNFYDIKKNSIGPMKFIAKMLLNQLYGIFGRRQDLLQTVNVYNKDIPKYLLNFMIINKITIDEEKSTLLMKANVDNHILIQLNSYFKTDFTNFNLKVQSNVAIASAVTAYARIIMMPFKKNYNVWYSDTDSIIIDTPLDPKFIGNELGQMKDELNGCVIEKAYFLGIKQYGYKYKDKNNNIVEKSTFAGVTKNSISFNEIEDIHNGKTIIKPAPLRFYKSLKDLSIVVKSDTLLELKRTNEKTLNNNDYKPKHINTIDYKGLNIFEFIKNKIIKILKFYNIKK